MNERNERLDTNEAVMIIGLVTAIINLATAIILYKASKKD